MFDNNRSGLIVIIRKSFGPNLKRTRGMKPAVNFEASFENTSRFRRPERDFHAVVKPFECLPKREKFSPPQLNNGQCNGYVACASLIINRNNSLINIQSCPPTATLSQQK